MRKKAISNHNHPNQAVLMPSQAMRKGCFLDFQRRAPQHPELSVQGRFIATNAVVGSIPSAQEELKDNVHEFRLL
jgi:hypothetical protein